MRWQCGGIWQRVRSTLNRGFHARRGTDLDGCDNSGRFLAMTSVPARFALLRSGLGFPMSRLPEPYPSNPALYPRIVDMDLPGHVVDTRRDGRRTILLHRAMAVISPDKIEIKSARGTVILPFLGILMAAGAIAGIALGGSSLPFWVLTLLLVVLLILVPFSVMSLISALVGADVVIDRQKGSATWQQGYLGMGIGTKDLFPSPRLTTSRSPSKGARRTAGTNTPTTFASSRSCS